MSVRAENVSVNRKGEGKPAVLDYRPISRNFPETNRQKQYRLWRPQTPAPELRDYTRPLCLGYFQLRRPFPAAIGLVRDLREEKHMSASGQQPLENPFRPRRNCPV